MPAATGRNQRRFLVIGGVVTAIVVAAGLMIAFRPQGGGGGKAPSLGTSVYKEEFNEQPNWDGYRFAPSAAGDARTVHGYEPDKGDYALFADTSYPRNPALSPVPAKNAAQAEATLQITAPGIIRELRGHGEIGLLCRWDEEDGSGYMFLLSDKGKARIVHYAAGVSTDLASGQAKTPEKGESVQLAALCHTNGKSLVFWVDGDQVLTASDSSELPQTTRAQVGVVVQVPEAGDNKIIAAYDSFAVTRP
jgi:hypothetical protein